MNLKQIRNSLIMPCLPIQLYIEIASGLSYIQVDNHSSTYIIVDLAGYEIFCAKFVKGSINNYTERYKIVIYCFTE